MPFLLLFITFLILPLHSATSPELAFSPKWQKLLHYKQGPLGGWESEADGKDFFLHPKGKTDPEAELTKAIEVFSSETKPQDGHGICKFPLRFKWLNQKLGFPWKVDFSGCTKYISFFSKLAARRASIVFSSYYLSNPNSAFGHTLLRLSRYEDRQETEMLDYGINFSAEARATNPLTYAVKGLMGGYEGRFAAIPYYYKIREYSDAEFRDLWSYDLKLTLPQVLEMVDHIWELGHTHFDYFYFHENCSYHLLGLLDVVMPEKNLTTKFKWFTIPADSIRLLHKEGLIEEGKKRESTHSRLTRLSKGQRLQKLALARKIARSPEKAEALLQGRPPEEAAAILDVALEAFDFYNAEKILNDDEATMKRKAPLLAARARNPIITESAETLSPLRDSPAMSHSPTRLGLYYGYDDNLGQQGTLELRAAHHDILDPTVGSLREGELEMFRVALNYSQEDYRAGGFRLDQFSILSIKNFPAQDEWSSPLSWEMATGIRQLERMNCFDCPGGYFQGSVGNSLHLGERTLLVALLLNADILVHNAFAENFELGIGPKIFTRLWLTDELVYGMSLMYHWQTNVTRRPFSEQRVLAEGELRYHFHPDVSFALKSQVHEEQDGWMVKSQAGLQYFY